MLTKIRARLANEEGFTLIELLVVILIIGILAAVAIPTFLSQKNKAYGANAKSNLKSAQTVIESYSNGNDGSYPATASNGTLTSAFSGDADAQSLTGVTYTQGSSSTTNDNYLLSDQTTGPAETYYLDVVNGTAYYGTSAGGVASAPAVGSVPTGANWSTDESSGWAS